MSCTATPIVSGNKLILHAVNAVQAFELQTGKLLWQANCSTTATSTPVLAGNEVVVATWNQTGESSLVPLFPEFEELVAKNDANGDELLDRKELPRLMIFHRSEGTDAPHNGRPLNFGSVDKNRDGLIDPAEWEATQEENEARRVHYKRHGMVAIKVDNHGQLGTEKIRSLEMQGIPEVPSPLYHQGHVYFVKNGGILTCLELETGKRLYRFRTGGRGTHYASPIIAGNRLITTAGDGRVTVIQLGEKATILASNDLNEPTFATPAIDDGVLYIRTHQSLFAFAKK